MSLILEALRKSEAERQRGRAPGLFVEQMATRPAARARAPAWAWGLGALLVAAVLLLGWREWSRASSDPPPQERGQVQFPSPTPAGTPAPTAVAIPPMPAVTRAPAPQPVPAPAAPAATAAAPEAPEATAPAPSTTSPSTAAVSPAEVNLTPFPTPFPAPAESLPSLASLDAGTRAQLPPLKLSMHVYAEQPTQRFVILDGRRLGEGASPAAGIVLEEIRRDGLVLSVNGQRLLLARP